MEENEKVIYYYGIYKFSNNRISYYTTKGYNQLSTSFKKGGIVNYFSTENAYYRSKIYSNKSEVLVDLMEFINSKRWKKE